MPELWMPGAKKIDLGDHAPCESQYAAKAIAHITADEMATAAAPKPWVPHNRLEGWFTGSGKDAAPHILWSPFTGQFTQFMPADSRSKSLRDLSGGIRTNRAGKVVIQIEAVFFPYCTYGGQVFARLKDTPCKNWHLLEDWIASWGVPRTWPGGIPTALSRDTVSTTTFLEKAGWFGHSQVPENDHVDPGSWPNFIPTVPKPTPVPKPTTAPPFPGVDFFKLGSRNKYVTEVDKQLIRLGFTTYHDGNGYQAGPYYSEFTRRNVAAFQRYRGWTGSGADGYVGPRTWHDLHTVSR